jgi:hypothetical protein
MVQLLVHDGARCALEHGVHAPGRVRREGLDLGAARDEGLEQGVAELSDLLEQESEHVHLVAGLAVLDAPIDHRQHDARALLGPAPFAEHPEDLLGLLKRCVVLHGHQQEIAGRHRVAREDLEVALGVDDDETMKIGPLECLEQGHRIVDLLLELRCVHRRGDVVNAVLAEPDDVLEGARAQARRDGVLRRCVVQREHAVELGLVVHAQDQDRKILTQCAEVDREVGRDGRLADTTLVARYGEHLEGPLLPDPIGEHRTRVVARIRTNSIVLS